MRCPGYCYLLDLYRTLCSLTGVPAPVGAGGLDLAPVLRGRPQSFRSRLFYAYGQDSYQRAVQGAQFKLIEYFVAGRRTTELYDLFHDPWETNNLAGLRAYAGRVASLRRALAACQVQYRDPQPPL